MPERLALTRRSLGGTRTARVFVIRQCGCYHPISRSDRGGLIMSDRDGNSVLWFLAGLGVGAVVGVLYAPRSGSETRQVIRDKAEEGRDYVRSRAQDARNQASEDRKSVV